MMNLNNFFNSPMMKAIKFANNPYAEINNQLQQNMGDNPLLNNVFNMVKNGNETQLRTMAENLCKERGMDINEIENKIKQNFGIS